LNSPDANQAVGVTGEEGSSIRGPSQGDALNGNGLLGLLREVRGELIDDDLGFQVPDLDGLASGSAQPVSDGGEAEGVDGVSSIKGGQVASFVEVPEHGSSVLSTRGAERSIWGDSDGVDVASVAEEVGAEFDEALQGPDLDNLVPTSRDDQSSLLVR